MRGQKSADYQSIDADDTCKRGQTRSTLQSLPSGGWLWSSRLCWNLRCSSSLCCGSLPLLLRGMVLLRHPGMFCKIGKKKAANMHHGVNVVVGQTVLWKIRSAIIQLHRHAARTSYLMEMRHEVRMMRILRKLSADRGRLLSSFFGFLLD